MQKQGVPELVMHVEKRIGPNFAEFLCRGPYSTSEMIGIADDALEIASQNGLDAVLIDWFSITGVPSVLDRFDLGTSFAELQISKPKLVRVALVGKVPQIDRLRFGETVARNRNAVAMVFENREEAVSWLVQASD